ncbi:hypothetical protein Y032_0008g169 [Ancylostoma ceylanicum]|uniref:Uncharacterized protein n=1 Tax=Ancylostoma ceylanicum TaxID=53326 RepID=A0A016VL61_9BILA|nr:hypothetical protein Y032_0008g169 [Ancylostoma ceylanicum]
MNFLLYLTIFLFLFATTVVSQPSGKCVATSGGDVSDGGEAADEGRRRHHHKHARARKFRVKAAKKRVAKKVKKVRRKLVKKNKH